MKRITILSIVFVASWALSCKEETPLACEDFTMDLSSMELDMAKERVDGWLDDLFPIPTDTDQLGHATNLSTFVDRMQQDCNVSAVIECYGCIYTLPPISEVAIYFDSSGIEIKRTLDISTPEDDFMRLVGVHD